MLERVYSCLVFKPALPVSCFLAMQAVAAGIVGAVRAYPGNEDAYLIMHWIITSADPDELVFRALPLALQAESRGSDVVFSIAFAIGMIRAFEGFDMRAVIRAIRWHMG